MKNSLSVNKNLNTPKQFGKIFFKDNQGNDFEFSISQEIADTLGIKNSKGFKFFMNVEPLFEDEFTSELPNHQFISFKLGDNRFLVSFNSETCICNIQEVSDGKIFVNYSSSGNQGISGQVKFGSELPLRHSCSFKVIDNDFGKIENLEFLDMTYDYGGSKKLYSAIGFGKLIASKLNGPQIQNLVDTRVILTKVLPILGVEKSISSNENIIAGYDVTLNCWTTFLQGAKNIILVDELTDSIGMLPVDSSDPLEDFRTNGLLAVWKRYAGGHKRMFVNDVEIRGLEGVRYDNVDELIINNDKNDCNKKIVTGRIKINYNNDPVWQPFKLIFTVNPITGVVTTEGLNGKNIEIESFLEPIETSAYGAKGLVKEIGGDSIYESFFIKLSESGDLYGSVQTQTGAPLGVRYPFYGDFLIKEIVSNSMNGTKKVSKIVACRDFCTEIGTDGKKKTYCNVDVIDEHIFKKKEAEANRDNYREKYPRKIFPKNLAQQKRICLEDEVWKIQNGYARIQAFDTIQY